MKTTIRKFGSIALTLMLLLFAVGGAAAIAWDTETTTTTTASDVSGTSNALTLYAGNTSETTYFEVSGASSENLTLHLQDKDTGTVFYTNSSAATEDATNGHYSWTITHSELSSNLASDYSGGEYEVLVLNESGGDELHSNVTYTFDDTTNSTARIFVANESSQDTAYGSSLVAHGLDTSTDDAGMFASLFGMNDTQVASFSDETSINGSGTTVEYQITDKETVNAFDNASADTESGEWMQSSTLRVGPELGMVYDTEAPEGAEGTFGVYDADSNTLTVHRSDTFNNSNTLSVSAGAGEGFGFGEAWSAFGTVDAMRLLA